MEESLLKINWLKGKQKNNHYLIAVDGGINNETCALVKYAGADVVVVGTYLTKGEFNGNKIKHIEQLLLYVNSQIIGQNKKLEIKVVRDGIYMTLNTIV